VRAWPNLVELHLDHNFMQGTLPASWGTGGAMQSLANLTLNDNNLTGSIPESWGDDSIGQPHFAALKTLTLKPGMRLQKPLADFKFPFHKRCLPVLPGMFKLGHWIISLPWDPSKMFDAMHLFHREP